MDFASEVKGAEVRDSPVDMFDDGRRAAEGDGEGEGLHRIGLGGFAHSFGFGSSEPIYILEWVSNSNKTVLDESFEHGVVNRAKVLVFVNKNQWESWECTSEQCGHVYLIVVINKTIVGLADTSRKDGVNKVGGKVIGALFEKGVEAGLGE